MLDIPKRLTDACSCYATHQSATHAATHARSPAGKSTGRRLQQNRRYNRKLYLRFHADNRAAAGAGAAATPDPLQAAGAAAPVTQSAGAGHLAPPPNHRFSPPAADPPARRPAGLLAAAPVSAHGGAGPTSDARVAAAVHHFSSTARAAGRAEALEFAAAICALVSEQDALFVFGGRRAVSTYVSGGPARPRPGLARPARPRRPGSGRLPTRRPTSLPSPTPLALMPAPSPSWRRPSTPAPPSRPHSSRLCQGSSYDLPPGATARVASTLIDSALAAAGR